jgi:hypothetical protein
MNNNFSVNFSVLNNSCNPIVNQVLNKLHDNTGHCFGFFSCINEINKLLNEGKINILEHNTIMTSIIISARTVSPANNKLLTLTD